MDRDDHYVAQTYLKQFACANGDLIPYYKRFRIIVGKPKTPKAICFETDGDTNRYFSDPRVLDQYLPIFENPWCGNIEKLEKKILDGNTKYEIAGYIAFLRTCNPTAKRLGQETLAGIIEPEVNSVLSSSLKEDQRIDSETKLLLNKAIEDGKIIIDVDRVYAHALGISSLIGVLNRYYCSNWLVLENNSDIPFVTNDNPATLYYPNDNPQYAQVFLPLKPNLAVLIAPDLLIKRPEKEDVVRYTNSNDRFGIIKRKYVKLFNKLIVKSAEERVLHSAAEEWLERLVEKYQNWRMETLVDYLHTENGVFIITRQRQVEITT